MTRAFASKSVIAAAVLALMMSGLAMAQDVVNSPYVVTGATGKVHIYPTPEQTRQIKQQVGLAPTGVLTYHGGPIMTGLNLYAIFWVPLKLQNGTATSLTAHYESEATQFLADYPYHGIANNSTQYYSKKAGVPTYFAGIGGLAGSVVDTNPYPASGCTDSATLGNCITDAQLQAEISKVMAAQKWTPGLNKIYLVFTSIGEGSCMDTSSTSCAYSTNGYCAYHGNFYAPGATNPTIYANMPWADPRYCYSAASGQHSPNGGMPADAVVSIASHEITEASTDPLVSGGPYGWYDDANGYEIGDLCAWMFGTADWDGGLANQYWNGHFYDIQLEYDNHTASCVKVGP